MYEWYFHVVNFIFLCAPWVSCAQLMIAREIEYNECCVKKYFYWNNTKTQHLQLAIAKISQKTDCSKFCNWTTLDCWVGSLHKGHSLLLLSHSKIQDQQNKCPHGVQLVLFISSRQREHLLDTSHRVVEEDLWSTFESFWNFSKCPEWILCTKLASR
jgi:hypothetical protein